MLNGKSYRAVHTVGTTSPRKNAEESLSDISDWIHRTKVNINLTLMISPCWPIVDDKYEGIVYWNFWKNVQTCKFSMEWMNFAILLKLVYKIFSNWLIADHLLFLRLVNCYYVHNVMQTMFVKVCIMSFCLRFSFTVLLQKCCCILLL